MQAAELTTKVEPIVEQLAVETDIARQSELSSSSMTASGPVADPVLA
jgi:hypothetical protein